MESIIEHSLQIKDEDRNNLSSRWKNGDFELFNNTNRHLNRYRNIIPFSHNRIHLPSSTYINASITQDSKYIMTQSPLSQTKEHFWEMIETYSCDLIVMLVQVQRGKCEQYWPNSFETETFTDFTLTTITSPTITPTTIMTKVSIKSRKTGKERIVTHFNFIKWPDHSVPSVSFSEFNTFLSDPLFSQTENPIVVHCSAGIERTASFIIMKTPLPSHCTELEELILLIKNRIIEMRQQRIGAVQLPRQFRYIVEYFNSLLTLR